MNKWKGDLENNLLDYEKVMHDAWSEGVYDQAPAKWSFWNAMFFCGTVYTTIGKCLLSFINNLNVNHHYQLCEENNNNNAEEISTTKIKYSKIFNLKQDILTVLVRSTMILFVCIPIRKKNRAQRQLNFSQLSKYLDIYENIHVSQTA